MTDPAMAVEFQQRAEAARERRQEESEDLIQRIQSVREEILTKVRKLHELSVDLRTKSRRFLADEGSNSYVMFANAHLRLAGALHQGLRRTGSTDRVLKIGQEEREEALRREAENLRRQEFYNRQKAANDLILTSDNAFEELYGDIVGEREVNDA